MHPGVALALIAAASAGLRTGLQDRAGDVRVVTGVTRQHARGGRAHVGTVEVAANALRQLADVVLRQARVGARGARLSSPVSTPLGRDFSVPVFPAVAVAGARARRTARDGR